MTRGPRLSPPRCLAVWLGVTAATGAGAATALPSAAALTAAADFEALLVAVAATALVGTLGWLWVVASLTVLDALRGRVRPGGAVRRLVLAACGAALAAGVASPAVAGPGGAPALDEPVLAGLPLPDRAVAGDPARPSRHRTPETARSATAPAPGRPADRVQVRAGDSLWAIAAASLPADASAAAVDARWRQIYRANDAVIGADPDLIRPGQRFCLPARDDH